MIKGWKLNPEWVRLMDEKKKALAERKMVGKITWLGTTAKCAVEKTVYEGIGTGGQVRERNITDGNGWS